MAESRLLIPRTISPHSVTELAADIESALADTATSAIVLIGRDGQFCEGLDLEALVPAEGEDLTRPDIIEARRTDTAAAVQCFGNCLKFLRFSNKPTVALVEGAARGGGVGLAAACDVVVASEDSSFALPELLFGLLPAVALPFLLDRISIQAFRLWALTGHSRSAAEAMADGLVDQVVAPTDLETAGRGWLRRLSRTQGKTAAALKKFTAAAALNRDTALELGIALTTNALLDETVLSAVRDFLQSDVLPWERD